MKKPLVSIIVLSHNRWNEIKECLESLKKTKYPNFEVIVVDNHSIDGTLEKIKKHFKWVKVIENDKNL
ncbi:MAG: glycosyltransferase, partial [Methanosarcinales archaeon]